MAQRKACPRIHRQLKQLNQMRCILTLVQKKLLSDTDCC
ncbi:hypothetical protein Barb4_00385 [Bacteroidales bacterium Barb4]|nr:hypothetical protein Barb4_00385 [Bacteroidales bacterium Barb4]